MRGIKCESKGCNLMAVVLSAFDTPRKISYNRIVTYDRIVKWKCLDGHISETKSVIEPKPRDLVPDPPSVKRFHRKGFAGHAIHRRPIRPLYPPFLSNRVRHKERQAARAR